jgi:glycosyltransferase involved in cell wall biosynthesis
MADKNKKRILQIFPYYFPPDVPDNGGGVKRAAVTLISGLADSDFETYVMVPKSNPAYDQAFLDAGAKKILELDDDQHLVLELSRLGEKAYLLRYARRLWGSVSKIRRIVSQYDIELVHSHASSFLGGAIAAKMNRVPSVIHVHEYGFRLSRFANRFYYSVVPRLADRFATCAEFIRQGFIANGASPDSVRTVYNGVDLDHFSLNSVEPRGSFRNEMSIDPSALIVGFVGRFTHRKGVDIFVESALQVLHQRADAVFIVVGGVDEHVREEREYRESIIAQVEESGFAEQFRFVGGRSDMPEVYRALDLLVFCSPQDMGPLVPLEAMAMETPVIVSSDGGAVEEVVDGRNGIIVETGSASSIAEAVLNCLRDPKLLTSMSAQGRLHVENNFSQQKYVQSFLGIYRELLE